MASLDSKKRRKNRFNYVYLFPLVVFALRQTQKSERHSQDVFLINFHDLANFFSSTVRQSLNQNSFCMLRVRCIKLAATSHCVKMISKVIVYADSSHLCLNYSVIYCLELISCSFLLRLVC
jgi:hypothetical protein